jgi:hypothetical protein
MPKLVQGLSKFEQNLDIFICDFVVIVKKMWGTTISNVLWSTNHVWAKGV